MSDDASSVLGIKEYIERFLEREGVVRWDGKKVLEYATAVVDDGSVTEHHVLADARAALQGSGDGVTEHFPHLEGLIINS